MRVNLARTTRGIICFFCKVKDDGDDPCFEGEKILWGYPVKQDGTVESDCCLYCMKDFRSIYKVRYGTIQNLKANFEEVKDDFMDWRKVCVDKVKLAQRKDVRLTGADCQKAFEEEHERRLEHRQRPSLFLK